MFTRCTHCEAVFRIRLDQLQASGGQARCGECEVVFDAFRFLSASDPTQAESGAPPSPAPESAPPAAAPDFASDTLTAAEADSGPVAQEIAADLQQDAEAALLVPLPEFEPAPAHLAGEEFVFERVLLPSAESGDGTETLPALDPPLPQQDTPVALSAAEAFPDPEWPPPQEHPPVPLAALHATELPGADPALEAKGRGRNYAGWAAAAVLVLCIPLQAFVFFRDAVAMRAPAVRPVLETLCRPLGCRVPFAVATDRLVIEASELQALDPSRPHRVVLIATVRNGARFAQPYPWLELTLTDARDQVTGRRVFSPQDYLATGTGAESGFAPEAELDVRLHLDTGKVPANGYRLYLYHP